MLTSSPEIIIADDMNYDPDMGDLCIGLHNFSKDEDQTLYDAYHRLEQMIVNSTKAVSEIRETINEYLQIEMCESGKALLNDLLTIVEFSNDKIVQESIKQ